MKPELLLILIKQAACVVLALLAFTTEGEIYMLIARAPKHIIFAGGGTDLEAHSTTYVAVCYYLKNSTVFSIPSSSITCGFQLNSRSAFAQLK